jgi:hypothetical protein
MPQTTSLAIDRFLRPTYIIDDASPSAYRPIEHQSVAAIGSITKWAGTGVMKRAVGEPERAWFAEESEGRAKARIERDFVAGEIVACPRVTRSETIFTPFAWCPRFMLKSGLVSKEKNHVRTFEMGLYQA